MKTIGLIGGMSWESSAAYYRLMNEQVKQRLGGLHSAKCILYSVDFQQIEHFQAKGEWDKAGMFWHKQRNHLSVQVQISLLFVRIRCIRSLIL